MDGIEITNAKDLERLFKSLDLRDRKTRGDVAKVMKDPFNRMKDKAKLNLQSGGHVKTGALKRGLTVRTKYSSRKGYFSVAFGGRTVKKAPKSNLRFKTYKRTKKRSAVSGATNHFHFLNSGTKVRTTKRGVKRGAVKKTGFADRAIKSVLPKVEGNLVEGIKDIIDKIIRNNTGV